MKTKSFCDKWKSKLEKALSLMDGITAEINEARGLPDLYFDSLEDWAQLMEDFSYKTRKELKNE